LIIFLTETNFRDPVFVDPDLDPGTQLVVDLDPKHYKQDMITIRSTQQVPGHWEEGLWSLSRKVPASREYIKQGELQVNIFNVNTYWVDQ